jgi:hypothetical protein
MLISEQLVQNYFKLVALCIFPSACLISLAIAARLVQRGRDLLNCLVGIQWKICCLVGITNFLCLQFFSIILRWWSYGGCEVCPLVFSCKAMLFCFLLLDFVTWSSFFCLVFDVLFSN